MADIFVICEAAGKVFTFKVAISKPGALGVVPDQTRGNPEAPFIVTVDVVIKFEQASVVHALPSSTEIGL